MKVESALLLPAVAPEDLFMRTAEDFIEAACRRKDWSYYRVAQHLDVTPSRLVRVRKGETSLTEPQAEKLAELLDLEPGIVYAEAKAARAKRTEVRAFWERVARSLAASLVLVFVGLFAPAQDAAAAGMMAFVEHAKVYIMRTAAWLRRALRLARPRPVVYSFNVQ